MLIRFYCLRKFHLTIIFYLFYTSMQIVLSQTALGRAWAAIMLPVGKILAYLSLIFLTTDGLGIIFSISCSVIKIVARMRIGFLYWTMSLNLHIKELSG